MGGIGGCCCDETPCGCDAIAEEDLPTVTITGMTGWGWESVAPCCWRQRFAYNTPPAITFTQKLLQDDSWQIYEENEIDQYYTNKLQESVVGGWDHLGVYAACGVPGDTPIPPTRPACRAILPTEPCLDYNRTSSEGWQQRWGFRSRPKYIDVSIQYTKATCSPDPEVCVYMVSSQYVTECESIFIEFHKQRVVSTYVASGPCCTQPPNTNVGFDYPSPFVEADFFGAAPFTPTFQLTTISSVKVASLAAQTINFGYNICSTCDITNGLTCYGECRNDCATASGTGVVHNGPYGWALCEARTTHTEVCSETYQFPCLDSHKHPWCEPEFEEYYCEYWYDPVEDWPTFPAVWTQKHLGGVTAYDCAWAEPENTYFGTQYFFLSEPINGHYLYNTHCLNPCVTTGVACTESWLTPWFVANRGQNIVLTYSYSCSGALTETICLNSTWSITFT